MAVNKALFCQGTVFMDAPEPLQARGSWAHTPARSRRGSHLPARLIRPSPASQTLGVLLVSDGARDLHAESPPRGPWRHTVRDSPVLWVPPAQPVCTRARRGEQSHSLFTSLYTGNGISCCNIAAQFFSLSGFTFSLERNCFPLNSMCH